MKFLKNISFSLNLIILINFANGQNQNPNRHHRATGYNRTHPNNEFMEKLSNLATLDAQQLKRLESLEQRVARIDATYQERLDSIKNDLNEVNGRTQNLDWLASKADRNLEQIKNVIVVLQQSFRTTDQRRPQQQTSSAADTPVVSSENQLNVQNMLEALSTLLLSTRGGVFSVEQMLKELNLNVTNLLQYTREIQQRQQVQPTKQFLNNILMAGKPLHSPVYAVVNSRGNGVSNEQSSISPSCAHLNQMAAKTGIQRIRISQVTGPFFVMCDMDTQEGGWTVIQNRKNGLINFNRNWLEYKFGFGNIAGEFWIGLDKLHEMTSNILHELLIVLEDFSGSSKYAKYDAFSIGGEKEDYALNLLGNYDGNAGDSLIYSASYKFSTFDNDNDGWIEGNCAQAHTGAWWYNACETSNLNGQYLAGPVPDSHRFQGMYWNDFHGANYSLKSVKMMIRPADRVFNPDLS